jgi:hypothetical protein
MLIILGLTVCSVINIMLGSMLIKPPQDMIFFIKKYYKNNIMDRSYICNNNYIYFIKLLLDY